MSDQPKLAVNFERTRDGWLATAQGGGISWRAESLDALMLSVGSWLAMFAENFDRLAAMRDEENFEVLEDE